MTLTDARMRELGFTDHREGYWYYVTRVGTAITWNVTINKKTGGVELEVLDECFLQPYPFQKLAADGLPFAMKVAEKVSEKEEWLREEGVL